MSEDLCRWLAGIGLEQHAETFAANDIDLDLLPDLSDEDLKELGLSLGHRRRLLRAISETLSEQSQPTPFAGAAAGSDAVRVAERRQSCLRRWAGVARPPPQRAPSSAI